MILAALQSAQNSPLFTNDLAGFLKIVMVLLISVLLPLMGLVVYFLKRGPDMALVQFRSDLNGLGTKVNDMQMEQARLKEQLAAVYGTITGSQQQIMEAIRASGEAQIRAVHLVELEVARLQERGNLGDCLATFGASIEKLASAIHRDNHAG